MSKGKLPRHWSTGKDLNIKVWISYTPCKMLIILTKSEGLFTLLKSLHMLVSLQCLSLSGWSKFCESSCLSRAVQRLAVLQENPSVHTLVFQQLLFIPTLSSCDCRILRSVYTHWGQLRDSNATGTKYANINALRAGGVNFWKGWRCEHFSDFV